MRRLKRVFDIEDFGTLKDTLEAATKFALSEAIDVAAIEVHGEADFEVVRQRKVSTVKRKKPAVEQPA